MIRDCSWARMHNSWQGATFRSLHREKSVDTDSLHTLNSVTLKRPSPRSSFRQNTSSAGRRLLYRESLSIAQF